MQDRITIKNHVDCSFDHLLFYTLNVDKFQCLVCLILPRMFHFSSYEYIENHKKSTVDYENSVWQKTDVWEPYYT